VLSCSTHPRPGDPLFSVGAGHSRHPQSGILVLSWTSGTQPRRAPPIRFLRKLVSVAFQQRRKTLANGLRSYAEAQVALSMRPSRGPESTGETPETLSPRNSSPFRGKSTEVT